MGGCQFRALRIFVEVTFNLGQRKAKAAQCLNAAQTFDVLPVDVLPVVQPIAGIRARGRTQQLDGVIVMQGTDSQSGAFCQFTDDEKNIYAAGYDGYIAKHFHYRGFLAMVEQTLDGGTAECADRSDHRMPNLNAVFEWRSGHSNGR